MSSRRTVVIATSALLAALAVLVAGDDQTKDDRPAMSAWHTYVEICDLIAASPSWPTGKSLDKSDATKLLRTAQTLQQYTSDQVAVGMVLFMSKHADLERGPALIDWSRPMLLNRAMFVIPADEMSLPSRRYLVPCGGLPWNKDHSEQRSCVGWPLQWTDETVSLVVGGRYDVSFRGQPYQPHLEHLAMAKRFAKRDLSKMVEPKPADIER